MMAPRRVCCSKAWTTMGATAVAALLAAILCNTQATNVAWRYEEALRELEAALATGSAIPSLPPTTACQPRVILPFARPMYVPATPHRPFAAPGTPQAHNAVC